MRSPTLFFFFACLFFLFERAEWAFPAAEMSLALVPFSLSFCHQISHFAAQHWYDYWRCSSARFETEVRLRSAESERNSGNTDSLFACSSHTKDKSTVKGRKWQPEREETETGYKSEICEGKENMDCEGNITPSSEQMVWTRVTFPLPVLQTDQVLTLTFRPLFIAICDQISSSFAHKVES